MNNLKEPLSIFQNYTKGTIGFWQETHPNFVGVPKKQYTRHVLYLSIGLRKLFFLQITSFKHTSLSNNSFLSTEKFTNSNVFLQ